jgi:hypothetical protein
MMWTGFISKNVVFWDAALCRSWVNRRFGGTYRLHLQGRKTSNLTWIHLAQDRKVGRAFVNSVISFRV